MDDIVRQALAKWPNVPACYGWLMLDRRGTWRMRDEAAQRAGTRGSPVRHAALIAFIVRNYDVDEHGQWFFQNGPQRVYLELEYTPFVVRLARDVHDSDASQRLDDSREAQDSPERHASCNMRTTTHDVTHDALVLTDQIGAQWQPEACWVDEHGVVLFSARVADDSRTRIGVLHDHDLDLFADFVEGGVDDAPATRFNWHKDHVLPMNPIQSDEVARQFGFVKSPAEIAAQANHP